MMMMNTKEEKDYGLSEDIYDLLMTEATYEDPDATKDLPKEVFPTLKNQEEFRKTSGQFFEI